MNIKRISALMAAVLALGTALAAFADSITFEGKVVSATEYPVFATIGGTADEVSVSVGDAVTEGDAIIALKTDKVYATESGAITGLFIEPGDNTSTVSQRYGAALYIEPDVLYTISVSTENAYNSAETKFVRVGEEVYLSCYSDGDHTGKGIITSIDGINYTVDVTEGEFLVGETVSVFRTEKHRSSSRIGRGTLTRKNPTAVTGSGSVVSIAVSDGDTVQRGDLLFETLSGEFDGLYMSGAAVKAPVTGHVAALNVSAGQTIADDALVATIYPEGSMRLEAHVSESDLGSIEVGTTVSIELDWNRDDEITYSGTVTAISGIADQTSGDDNATYRVFIDFTPDENTRYGMNATITTVDADALDADEADE